MGLGKGGNGGGGEEFEEGNGGTMGLGKGRAVVAVEVLEMALSLLVEMKVVEGGGEEFEGKQWWEFKEGLEDVVLSWHNTKAVVA
ncbi:CBL-interacting serine/threonine-protein kinase 7-like [Tripterygium wilfordii]|uniref:CBL-interacting serine/threonine-protein kinase 7-like n=1 Tax=Tripterygium wilfordii TaxID=458696 RepID=A0A7J7D8K5_TRIWF|nr:CBL-interacting serine/threonine-protein kinase 7-like [Tripterygium wilfordii]